MENIFHANGKQKKAGVAILTTDKIDLKTKKITRDEEAHYIMIKGSIQEEDITIVCKYLCSLVQLFATPQTVAYEAPLSMGFSRQEYWSGLPFPSPGDLPDSVIEPGSPALQADTLLSEPPGKPPYQTK